MPVRDEAPDAVRGLQGLHLWHFQMSNCSQRVRFCLEEKGLDWTSHHVDLPGGAHLTPDYLALNPAGVVPTLVHDGRVIVESNDILLYLDDAFGGPQLMPSGEEAAVRDLLDRSGAIQPAIKVLSHELLFKNVRKVSAEDVERMEGAGASPDLVSFMRDYAQDGEAWAARVAEARRTMDKELVDLDHRLGTHDWLSGPAFGLADISWAVNGLRLKWCGYPTDAFPHWTAWCARVEARPAFKTSVVDWQPAEAA